MGGSTLLHFILLPVLLALLGLRALAPTLRPEVYHVSSTSIRMEHHTRPMPRAIPQPHVMPQLRKVIAPSEMMRTVPQPRPTLPPVPIAYRPPVRSSTIPPVTRAQIDPKTIASQERAYAATIAAARAASNPLSISKSEQPPTSITRANYNFVGSQARSQHGDGVLYPVKRWTEGELVYYYLRYTVHYPSGDDEAGEVPWPVRYAIWQDPFAHADSQRIPLPGPASNYVASADTTMKPLIAHCYRLREPYCDIMPSPQ